ncbi:MAG TPA: hypothetical protein VMS45_11210, partial [Gemmatimonadaceae bacterium]|nr:hypothetical protein [Gemmatimonadaceae bacterium]
SRWTRASEAREANRAAAAIGLALGCCFSVRPYDAVIAAIVIGAFQLGAARGRSRGRSRRGSCPSRSCSSRIAR